MSPPLAPPSQQQVASSSIATSRSDGVQVSGLQPPSPSFGLTFLHRLDLRPPLGFLASSASRCHTGLLIFSLHPPSSSITVRPFQISCIATCRSYPAGFRVVQADPHGFRIPHRNIHSLKRTARLTPRVAYTAALRLLLLLVDRNNADLDTLFYTIRALLIMVSDTT